MRLLIYAGTRGAVQGLLDALPGSFACWKSDEFEGCMIRFRDDSNAIMVTSCQSLAMGWRAPVGTRVLFDSSFPDDRALRAQAKARVAVDPANFVAWGIPGPGAPDVP